MFTKQPEAVAAYKKLGLAYPEEVADAIHEKFLAQTSKSPEQCNFCTITSLIRVKTPLEGKENLVYSLNWHRTDSLGNIRHSFISGLGKGPKLQPVTRIRKDENGYEQKYVARAEIVGTEYYIPYTGPESVEKLIKKLEKEHGATLRLDTEEGRRKAALDLDRRQIMLRHVTAIMDVHVTSAGFQPVAFVIVWFYTIYWKEAMDRILVWMDLMLFMQLLGLKQSTKEMVHYSCL